MFALTAAQFTNLLSAKYRKSADQHSNGGDDQTTVKGPRDVFKGNDIAGLHEDSRANDVGAQHRHFLGMKRGSRD